MKRTKWIMDSRYGVVPKSEKRDIADWMAETFVYMIIFTGLITICGFLVLGLISLTHPVMMGDVNRDGRVNAADLTMMERHLIGTYDLTPAQIRIGDMNGNGRIDQRDINTLVDIVLERPVITYEN